LTIEHGIEPVFEPRTLYTTRAYTESTQSRIIRRLLKRLDCGRPDSSLRLQKNRSMMPLCSSLYDWGCRWRIVRHGGCRHDSLTASWKDWKRGSHSFQKSDGEGMALVWKGDDGRDDGL